MQRKSQCKSGKFKSTIRAEDVFINLSASPKWREKGYYRKGMLVRRRRTKVETREVADKKWGLGIITKEIAHDGVNWLHVEVYWQGMKKKCVEKKNDVERASVKVESVVIPEDSMYIFKEDK